ncbi:histone deacetylase family protein [Acidianus sulfidivorans JP7]|uniref:Acetoin utilization protein n=1 Tax=Acidianus sulfidivorans JP7 TaxID=619593 RepID=A0A2U9IPM2_9CREN|nr:histone deacetylase [Acidianus sulfidivorans]AWR97961.1 histone deacetylase family protein [Acidianus sulfidivorans JP7]
MLGIIWDDRFLEITFSHPMIRDISKQRLRKFWELIKDEPDVLFIKPEIADEEELRIVHTNEYIQKLKEASEDQYIGFLDSGDTVHYPGMFKDLLLIVGSSNTAIKYLKFLDKIYIPIGGFHHAFPNSAMGFCPINDVAITVKKLQNEDKNLQGGEDQIKKGRGGGGRKIAIVDVDAHHGNGLQYILYSEPILKINIFAYDGKFFPGTGNINERGSGEGYGYNFNVPLPLGTSDDGFEEALKILDILYDYKPDYLLVLAGVDGHKEDSLKSLNLSLNSFNLLGYKIHKISSDLKAKVISYGGGGYGEYSSLCMLEFLRGLKGIREYKEQSTEDKEKIHQVRKIVDSLIKSLPNSLKQ